MSSATPSARGLSIWITALGFIAASALAQDRSWIERSDRNTAMVFETLGAFYPEWMASLGIDKFDTGVLDLKADRVKRIDAALAAQVARLSRLKAKESDHRVREDLDIVIDALERQRRTAALEYRLLLPFDDLPRQLFQALQNLLDLRNPAERRQHALGLLRGYAGMEPGSVPIAQLARERLEERANTGVLWPSPFAEVRDEMALVAADITRERKLPSADYRQVLRELKREVLAPDVILPFYKERLADIERIITRERLVSLPQRAASIRLASEAESAAVPAPYLNVPRLIGNRGEVGEFVLPLSNPNVKSGARADDFTSPASAWSLTAHEARPGHELQFAAMVERGVSLARAVFAANSTNAE